MTEHLTPDDSAVQCSGTAGPEDFVSGPEAGAVITTPRHQVAVIVTEYGAPERATHGRAPFPA